MFTQLSFILHNADRPFLQGRIGHKGLATSFYNERDEPLAQDLVNLLIECRQEIPDFLQSYIPEDGAAHFDDDDESDTDGGAAVDAQEVGATRKQTKRLLWRGSVTERRDRIT